MKGNESIFDCARRETYEETGLTIEAGPILYIQEFWQPDYHFIKFFILARSFKGKLTTKNREKDEHFLVDARWFSKIELQETTAFPEPIKDEFWKERLSEPVTARYIGLEKIIF